MYQATYWALRVSRCSVGSYFSRLGRIKPISYHIKYDPAPALDILFLQELYFFIFSADICAYYNFDMYYPTQSIFALKTFVLLRFSIRYCFC